MPSKPVTTTVTQNSPRGSPKPGVIQRSTREPLSPTLLIKQQINSEISLKNNTTDEKVQEYVMEDQGTSQSGQTDRNAFTIENSILDIKDSIHMHEQDRELPEAIHE